MNNLRNKINKFMIGRYGTDELYLFLFTICFIILMINTFINSIILRIIELILIVVIFYRFLSKNRTKRNKENKKYLELKEKVKKEFNYIKMRYKDRNTHMYKKCPKCNQRVRLPLKKGKHTVKCPNCKNKFEVKCKRDEKIKVEIIK